MACKTALVLAISCVVVTLTVVILIMVTLSSTLVIFRHRLPIGTDTRTFMSINIRAHVYQHVYWHEDLVLLVIFELAQISIVTRMSRTSIVTADSIDTNLMSTSINNDVNLKGSIGISVIKVIKNSQYPCLYPYKYKYCSSY